MQKENNYIIAYHGTPNKFENFSYEFMRTTGLEEGYGFYFTNDIDIALRFSNNNYLMECKFPINKALSEVEKTIKKADFKKLVLEIQKERDFLSNYGEIEFEGFEVVLNRAINSEYSTCSDDTELLASLSNGIGSIEDVLKATRKILGYDHIKSTQNKFDDIVYIVLDNDDIEILETIDLRELDPDKVNIVDLIRSRH